MMSVPLNLLAVSLLQGEVGFSFMDMWNASGPTAKATLIILAIMSAWSIGVMIDRYLAFNAARKQSREFAPLVAGCLQEGKIGEAIDVSEQNQKSHLAKVVIAGLQEYQSSGSTTSTETIEASKRALDRATAVTNAELKRGVPGLATIGSTAPFVGLFGTVVGIINAFQGCPRPRPRVFPRWPAEFPKRSSLPRWGSSWRFPPSGCSITSMARWKPLAWR